MKIFSKTFAAAAAITLCLNTAVTVNAAVSDNIQPSAITVTADNDIPSFTSDEEMLKYVRNQMKQRKETITLLIPNKGEDDERHYSSLLTKDLFDYTGDPAEGRYLHLSLIQNASLVRATDKGIYIEVSSKYYTTAEQEEELDQNIQLVKTMLLSKVKSLPAEQQIKEVYETLISTMKLSDSTDPSLCTAYSALANNTANERGYIQLFIRAVCELGFDCDLYYSNYSATNPFMAHHLAVVKLDDVYYFLDPIWDYKNGTKDKFLLKGYKDLDKGIPEDSEFRHEHLTMFDITLDSIAETSGMSQYSLSAVFDKGDVNGDKAVDSIDASSILAEYARQSSSDVFGTFSAGQKKAGDLDNNGKVDSSDASVILSYYAYTSTTTGNVKSIEEFIKNK